MEWLHGLLSLFRGYMYLPFNPFLYLAILLIWIQYKRQNHVEREMFGQRIFSATDQILRTLLYGCVAGVLGTVLLSVFAITVAPSDLLLLWVVSVILSLFHIRYLCFAYAGGILGLISVCLKAFVPADFAPAYGIEVWDALRNFSTADILALVAILHLLEALLVWLQGSEGALPVFVEGRRGKIVGGFVLQNLWMLPIVAFVGITNPGEGYSASIPVFSMINWNAFSFPHSFTAYMIAPLPVMLGYSTLSLTRNAQAKAKQSALHIAAFAIVLFILVEIGIRYSLVLLLASMFSFVAHECFILLEKKQEQMGTPLYIKPLKGLKLLSILPDSPAEHMDLRPGDTIVKVNGIPVNTPYDFHFAISQNPAYVKLDVLDERGELRLTGKPLYHGDHHQLGVILVPDETTLHYVVLYPVHVWSLVKRVFTRAGSKKGTTHQTGTKHIGASTSSNN